MKGKNLIINPYFLFGLTILLLNDFYLKYEYGNFLTGKLSDVAGLLIFPLFIAYLMPKLSKSISFITGIVFIIWKTPLASPFIDLINQLSFTPMHRTVDYTDYIALPILLLSHYLINYHKYKPAILRWNKLVSLSTYFVLPLAFFAFCSTSFPLREMPKGTVFIGESYTIKLPKDSIIGSIRQLGYNCDFYARDTLKRGGISYYQTDNIVRYYNLNNDSIISDTIANIKYELIELKPNKTKLTIINVTLSEKGNIQDWRKLKAVSRQYEVWLKQNLIKKID